MRNLVVHRLEKTRLFKSGKISERSRVLTNVNNEDIFSIVLTNENGKERVTFF